MPTTPTLVALAALLGPPGAADGPKPTTTTIHLIGDSTVHNPSRGLLGWGDALADRLGPAGARVVNRARGGRSSRTFLSEGLWDRALAEIQPGDLVLIQFGHNDGGPVDQGRARASLKGDGEEAREVRLPDGKAEVVHTYGWYIRRYAADARAKGARPVVLSPIPRNIWKDGRVARASGDYGGWASEAARRSGAAFLDLNELVARRYEAEGPAKVKAAYFLDDHTHTTPEGARLNAEVVAEGLRSIEGSPLRQPPPP